MIEIKRDALTANLSAMRNVLRPGCRIMAVVKANAYGHGLEVTASQFEQAGVDYFGVAFLEEGVALRSAGIVSPILVLGGIVTSQIRYFIEHNLDCTASSISKLEAIDRVAGELGKPAHVHLKIDTGMERIGVHYYSASQLLEASLRAKNVIVVGIYSHFATGEDPDLGTAKLQLERFLEVCSFYDKHSIPCPLRHIANSGALLQLSDSHLDLVRPGLALYGIAPAPHLVQAMNFIPALSLRSSVVYFKAVKRDAGVSYGHRWHADHDTRVVTVPIGYGDGYTRSYGVGEVLIGGRRRRIVGSICMDQLMADIGPDGTAYNGDPVVLIGDQGEERISVNDLARWAGTVPHEVLALLNTRLPRRYV